MQERIAIGGLLRIEIASVRSYLGNIVMNWAITIPTLVAVYLFPMELQITVSGFIGATQALLFIFMGRKA